MEQNTVWNRIKNIEKEKSPRKGTENKYICKCLLKCTLKNPIKKLKSQYILNTCSMNK